MIIISFLKKTDAYRQSAMKNLNIENINFEMTFFAEIMIDSDLDSEITIENSNSEINIGNLNPDLDLNLGLVIDLTNRKIILDVDHDSDLIDRTDRKIIHDADHDLDFDPSIVLKDIDLDLILKIATSRKNAIVEKLNLIIASLNS